MRLGNAERRDIPQEITTSLEHYTARDGDESIDIREPCQKLRRLTIRFDIVRDRFSTTRTNHSQVSLRRLVGSIDGEFDCCQTLQATQGIVTSQYRARGKRNSRN